MEWELNTFAVERRDIAIAFDEVARRYNMRWQLKFSSERMRIAVFVSRYDHCLLDLLYRHRTGELNGDIVAVFSNHADLESVAASFQLPYHLFPVEPATKRQQEQAEIRLLNDLGVDLIVLARYMQVLSPEFVERYPNRVINIHHSFLPTFVGGKPYHQAYERGVKLIGATSHYVTTELDEGPIIEQDVCRVTHRDSLQEMMRKGRDLERQVLGRAVRLHLQHRILPYGHKTVVFD